ncbi:epithelial cell adhesion molecule isoform X2 [Oncorhynchus tshawytscha]|uniref:epithelial cell adhesion molecule isoform X2 n=1 Tax=Oncorhynchus tshawytscha TaxID=74940 RepID=UPI000D0A1790|nr:epithelial cell adhesion molecule isoform X2 [Oncorhynchus tshawytscha]
MMIYILITDKECNDDAFPVREDCEVDTVCGEAICHHNQYVTCHVNRCGTCEPVFRGYDNITVNCTQLTPKCRLIHLEILSKHRTGTMLTGRSLGTKYHPNCDGAGMFRPKQCREEDTKLCWCVNKAGVPVSDKTHDPLKCDRLVTVHVIDIQFTFKVEFTPVAKTMDEIRRQLVLKLDRDYTLDKTQILDITVRELYQVVSIRLTDDRTDKEPVDIATVAYYIERDLKSNRFGFEVDGRRLEVARDSVKVLFFHYDHQHMDMMTINPGFAALILIIALAIIIGVSVSVSKSKTNCTLDSLQYHCHPHNFSLFVHHYCQVVVQRKALLERRFQFEVIEVQGQNNHLEQQEATMTYFVM